MTRQAVPSSIESCAAISASALRAQMMFSASCQGTSRSSQVPGGSTPKSTD